MRITHPALVVAAALLAAGGLSACNQSQAAKAAATGSAGAASPRAGLLSVPADQMSHVQVVRAAHVTWPNLLRLTGNVDYNQFNTSPVITQVSGPVARVLATPGEQVRQGQTLLEVSSPDFAQARSAYQKASDARSLAQKVYRRDQDLYNHHAIAQADVQQAESSLAQAQADFQAARQTLRVLGFNDPKTLDPNSPLPIVAVKAPITGTVVERDVAPGQLLQAGSTQCFVISNMSTVWVMANVYQSDLADVHPGDPVDIETDAYRRRFHGRIQFISPALDPNSRTVQARIETRNPDGELKKQMYVTAVVNAGSSRNLVVVPDAAVLRDDQNVPFVYIQTGNGRQFARRTVAIGQSRGGFTEITNGLKAGEPVVGDGALFLQFAGSFQ